MRLYHVFALALSSAALAIIFLVLGMGPTCKTESWGQLSLRPPHARMAGSKTTTLGKPSRTRVTQNTSTNALSKALKRRDLTGDNALWPFASELNDDTNATESAPHTNSATRKQPVEMSNGTGSPSQQATNYTEQPNSASVRTKRTRAAWNTTTESATNDAISTPTDYAHQRNFTLHHETCMKLNVWDAIVFPVDLFGSGIDSLFQCLALSMLSLFIQNLFTFCVGSSRCLLLFNHVLCLFGWSNVFWALSRLHHFSPEVWHQNGADFPVPLEIYVAEGICVAAMLIVVVELLCDDFASKEIVVRRSQGGYSVRQMSGGYMRARSEVQLDAESHNASDLRRSG